MSGNLEAAANPAYGWSDVEISLTRKRTKPLKGAERVELATKIREALSGLGYEVDVVFVEGWGN